MLTVCIIAKNEEKNIRRCLESVQWADEIIVLDSGSTDNTTTIARAYTDHVFETDWKGYGIQKQRALARATGDWILNLDADEVVSPRLKQAVVDSMAQPDWDAYRVPIRMCFYDKPLRFSSSPSRHIRLFKRKNAEFSDDIVHEKIILPPGARIGRLREPIIHHSFCDVSHAVYKMNRYSSYSAKIRINEEKQKSFLSTILSSTWMFFRCYILQAGFLDGKAGFLFAAINAQSSFYRGVKQWYPDHHMEDIP